MASKGVKKLLVLYLLSLFLQEKHVAEELYKKTQDTKYITLQGYVGNTFKVGEREGDFLGNFLECNRKKLGKGRGREDKGRQKALTL